MELRHLRYFIATAEAENFTKAALQLNIAQPPLGQQIRALEEEIGTPLFLRQGRGVVLSDAGRAFLGPARDILANVEEAKRIALSTARGEIGTLSLGFTESASFNEVVTSLISEFHRKFPKVHINLIEGNSEFLINCLRRGEIDAAIVRPPFIINSDISLLALSEEPLMVVLPDDHPLALRDQLYLEDLRDERFILYSRQSGYGLCAEVVAECRSRGFTPVIHQQAPQVSSAVNLVSAGMGVTIVPASMKSMQRPGLNFRNLKLELPKATLCLATRPSGQSSVIEGFVKCARSHVDKE